MLNVWAVTDGEFKTPNLRGTEPNSKNMRIKPEPRNQDFLRLQRTQTEPNPYIS